MLAPLPIAIEPRDKREPEASIGVCGRHLFRYVTVKLTCH
jgi:hypothetical protein